MAKPRYLITNLLLLLWIATGCSDGRPSRVPVTGKVLIDGRPLTHGYVRFIPEGARPSSGTLDSEGRFTLSCYEGADGAVVGKHRVEVSGMQSVSEWKARWHAPKKYADHGSSGITKEVTGPTDVMLIELSWEGGSPFTELDETAKAPPGVKSYHPGK
jgi:hypothetical protein